MNKLNDGAYLNPWTAIIPVRAGSQGLPNKNIRLLAGKPLYFHAVDQALAAGASKIIISTDIHEILNEQHHNAVHLISRPPNLCLATTPMEPVISHAIASAQVSGLTVLLQATSPLRTASDIVNAIDCFRNGVHELVMSVTKAQASVLKWGMVNEGRFTPINKPEYCFSNRQSLPALYQPNGAVYVFDAQQFMLNPGFSLNNIGAIEMDEVRSQDIDTIDDFIRCEQHFLDQLITD